MSVRYSYLLKVLTALLVLQTLSTQAAPAKKSEAQLESEALWKSLILFPGFGRIESKLEEDCRMSADHHYACLLGLEAALPWHLGLRILPKSLVGTLFSELAPPVYSNKLFVVGRFEEKAKSTKPQNGREFYLAAELSAKKVREEFQRAFPARAEVADLWRVIKTIIRNSQTPEEWAYGQFINAYEGVFDPVYQLIPKKELEKQAEATAKENYRFGYDQFIRQGKYYVRGVTLGSPAYRGDLRQGDRLISVGGVEYDLNSPKLDRVMAENGPIEFVVERKGRVLKLSLTRGVFEMPYVQTSVVEIRGRAYAVIKVETFRAKNLCAQVSQGIEKAQKRSSPLAGVILDFRGNIGGYLREAQCITSLFLPENHLIVTGRTLDGKASLRTLVSTLKNEELETLGVARTQLPLVIIQNALSASASEVVAGAIRDHQRGWIVGVRSFGKGTINEGIDQFGRQLIEFRTAQRFYQPSGTSNQIVGILPDFAVDHRGDAEAGELLEFRNEDKAQLVPHQANPPVPPPRPEQISKIKACVDQDFIESKESLMLGSKGQSDLQLLYATEVLRCDN